MFVPEKGFTHSGTFHADDVFSTALLKILNPNFTYERGFIVPENYDGIVYDIGEGKFDHHQVNNETRLNGVPYASFGKLWREFGEILFPKDVCENFDKAFIQQLDETDNTGKPNILSNVISSFNPAWDSTETSDKKFADAVDFAKDILEKQFEQINASKRAALTVTRDIEKMRKKQGLEKNILVLDKFIPMNDNVIKNKDILFVIFPSNRGGYMIQTISSKTEPTAKRCNFPKKWREMKKEDLYKIHKDLTFCHKGNYVAVANTKEGAVEIAKMAIEEYLNTEDKSIQDIINTEIEAEKRLSVNKYRMHTVKRYESH